MGSLEALFCQLLCKYSERHTSCPRELIFDTETRTWAFSLSLEYGWEPAPHECCLQGSSMGSPPISVLTPGRGINSSHPAPAAHTYTKPTSSLRSLLASSLGASFDPPALMAASHLCWGAELAACRSPEHHYSTWFLLGMSWEAGAALQLINSLCLAPKLSPPNNARSTHQQCCLQRL